MPKYTVKLSVMYSDTVKVDADSKEDAINKALLECDERYEYFYDAEVTQEGCGR